MLSKIGRVTIELSNRCDMAPFHKTCPLYGESDPIFLPLETAKKIIKWLGKQDFDKFITFHNYNESLQDPRLYYLLEYARKRCSKGSVYILTNGHWLNQTVLNELELFGVKKIYVSAYGSSDYRRLKALKTTKLKYRVRKIRELDDRLKGYDCPNKPRKSPCYAPLGEVVIRCTGDVVLCCRDWGNRHVFGNVINEPLADILVKKTMINAYNRLSKGDRHYEVCRGCCMGGRYKEK